MEKNGGDVKSGNKNFCIDWKWIVVIGACLARVVTTGTVVFMGVFLDDIKSSLENVSTFQLSLVFGFGTGFLEGLGFLFAFLIKKFEGRYLVFVGALLAFAGVLVSSWTTNYVLLLIGLGIFNGVGQAAARFILPVVVGHMFGEKDRHVGLSITNAGDGVGGVLAPILLSALIDTMTWRRAMLIAAAFVLNLCFSAATIPLGIFVKKSPKKSGKNIVENEQLEEIDSKSQNDVENASDSSTSESEAPAAHSVKLFPNILFFYSNIILHSAGYFLFMTFIYSEMKETRIDSSTVSRIVSLIGGVSIVGRLSVSLMKGNSCVPRWLTYAVCHVIRGFSVLATLWAPDDVQSKVVWHSVICSIYGLTDGVTGALIPVVCLDLFGLKRFADVLGYEMLIMGSGAFLGVPLGGVMKDLFASYEVSFIFSACSFILAGLVLFPLFFTRKDYQFSSKKGVDSKASRKSNDDGGVSLVKMKAKNFDE
uniref:Major facilitator superfamily (MFS) profile domain-containing protein n=1 Tax=Romanomermis culicivorax TaxID=13658 RepID=A0A915KH32_ROMCU